VVVSMLLVPFLGEDFFPSVDSGQITLHTRTPPGTRIEDTTQTVAQMERQVRRVIPADELTTIVDNIGLNQSPINLLYSNSGSVGLQDADIFITLKPGHRPTADFVRALRERMPRLFPDVTFSFPPPDITSQILNFGQPAPLDIQVTGTDRDKTEAFALRILREIRKIPGLVDGRMQQSSNLPQLQVAADRTRMAQLGLTERDVTNALATSLAGTSQSAPNFWLNPKNVAADVQKVIDANLKYLPRGGTVTLRGQVQTMNTAFSGLFYGLLAAVVLIYLLIVVNFQSWTDPFVIITALPAALAGIVWMLFATGTTLSVPALTGAIMCMGVATANSILVIAFARERLAAHGDAVLAAVEAGFTRFRPVCMTALAMIIGMAPMALGMGEGGEQNAPLGRAVIGGLVFATGATLLFVPVVFSIIHGRRAARQNSKGAAAARPPAQSGEAYA
jgi:multidrug efflux pump subunit AcrB